MMGIFANEAVPYRFSNGYAVQKQQVVMAEEIPMGDPELLKELLYYQMPFGKHKGQLIRALPVSYLEWFAQKGFPAGKLGVLLQTMYEIKLNGLEYLLDELTRIQRRGN